MAGSGGGCREKDQPKGRYLAWQPTSTPRKAAAVPMRWGGVLRDPRDMVKAVLPKP